MKIQNLVELKGKQLKEMVGIGLSKEECNKFVMECIHESFESLEYYIENILSNEERLQMTKKIKEFIK